MTEQEELEQRFQQYTQGIVSRLGHADREEPALMYLKGLVLPGERKSVEPMAARVDGRATDKTRQRMGHIAGNSPWEDSPILQFVHDQVIPTIYDPNDGLPWIILDDTGVRKKGIKSVCVARQYIGEIGKKDNCQVVVTITFATEHGSIPVAYRLYMPEEWAKDMERRWEAGIPDEIEFLTKNQIALILIDEAIARGVPVGIFLGDAAYGDDTDLRDGLTERAYLYALAVRAHTTVWWGKYQPATPEPQAVGRPRTRLLRDADHQPIGVSELARELPESSWETIEWREGTKGALSSRFARVRVRAAHEDKDRQEEWLVIEWPEGAKEPEHFFLSTLPESTTFPELVRHIKGRWRIERDYEELKSEFGLDHYEGRKWRGFHHHGTLCIAAYGFLVMERQRAPKLPDLDMTDLPFPEPPTSREQHRGRMQRHVPWSIATLKKRLAVAIAVEIAFQSVGREADLLDVRNAIAELIMNL
jgi:SRSO17 transposase